MPQHEKKLPNAHIARLRNPDHFDPDTIIEMMGGCEDTAIGCAWFWIPDTIRVIKGKNKVDNGPNDPLWIQSLEFPTDIWTLVQTKKWLWENRVNFVNFEKATEG